MLATIKQYLKNTVFLAIVALVCIVLIQHNKVLSLKEDLKVAKANEKAYIYENSILDSTNREFKSTIDQLNFIKDSLVVEMNMVRKKLKIKDKNLVQLNYLASKVQKIDTLIFRDTLFVDKTLKLDTTIKDEWHSINLVLEYPNKIITNPEFKSEKYIVFHNKKETINPPKKYKICRLFQRKHIIVEVEVIENNPYIVNNKQKFVKIIK